ncbi:methylated-DNA--[protein]-cysteine S-methyltransferase [Bacillus badius]|uniref:Methylated-DNA--protein-cysteine methyltransferase n=1 Tax=Bacillus badius TaxID=1455 RepID=A0ABR5AXD1_BACBA|nr:methylated-DNA--[protein]-cysteine S-methyltransferase [Bacillus badius]KIL79329.1 Methylated-DNA--protein-cysteine methyltransferase [Bacillus badius]KZR59730.1 cysteine methyltransferase [Bacillus badius]MED4716515.1 methylated-DNA--[protein]-cysteine S-methyltransferase [Bacillus badius]
MKPTERIIHWTTTACGQWQLYAAKTEKGLCYVSSPGQSYASFEQALHKRFPQAVLAENAKELQPFTEELTEYLQGKRQAFSLPVDIKGTPFQEKIWETLTKIPYGQTCSYSDIASLIENPKAVRAVGAAIGANPVLIAVPCHRVIAKNGAVTGYRGGIEMKQALLELEANIGSTASLSRRFL